MKNLSPIHRRKLDYARCLFGDMGIPKYAIQNWLNARTRGEVSFLDDLTLEQTLDLIEELKIRKREKNPDPNNFAVAGSGSLLLSRLPALPGR